MMKRIGYFFFCLMITAFVLTFPSGCYYDKEELLYGNVSCDTAAVTYSSSVAPIISANCNSCHAGTFPSGGLNLDSHAAIKLQVVSGKLIGAINHRAGFSPMPKNAPKLSACNIQTIQKWVDDGAPNN
jgi:hypothetical protein